MQFNPTSNRLLLPLQLPPTIHQAGLGEHGTRMRETFFRPGLWALHLYFWRGHLTFGGQRFNIQPRHIGLTPPRTTLTWHFPLRPCRHFFVHFAYPARSGSVAWTELPIMCPLENRFEQIHQQFEGVLKWTSTNRPRAEAVLWNLLWELTDVIKPESPMLTTRPGAMETALGIIENELDQSLNAKSLAQRVALSYSQLNRLFKDHFSVTLSEYITRERFKRADHLLRETNFSIKVIAEQVGIPDLQHFNKFIRLRTGQPPRLYRETNLPGASSEAVTVRERRRQAKRGKTV